MQEQNPDQFKGKHETEPPEISLFEREYLEAFYLLGNSRQLGMGVGPIPLSEILAYVEFYQPIDPWLMVYAILGADNAYLNEYNEEQKRKK